MYILPVTKREALFEYTLFSKDLLEPTEYEEAIKDYLSQLGIKEYEITEKERGSIPMTCFKFDQFNTKRVLNIGTVGGWTKASTGYTFRNTTQKTKDLINFLKTESDLKKFSHRGKFWFYDLLMLDVLAKDNKFGARLFSSLFKRSKVQRIFKFLDEETNVLEDISVMASVPPYRFIKALLNRIF
jgi:lycopene beta-cyclase